MASCAPPIHILNYQKVIEAFGYWPLFHDSEVRSLYLDRNRVLFGDISNPCIQMVIHAFEWTEATSTTPPVFNHHLVRFLFEEIDCIELFGFNHQNAILEARFEELEVSASTQARHRVVLDVAHGLYGSFAYVRGEVISVVPCDEKARSRPLPH